MSQNNNHLEASSKVTPFISISHEVDPQQQGLKNGQKKKEYASSRKLLTDKAQHLQPAVGVLISQWVSKHNNKIIAKNVGTAFAVTPYLLLTCTHNIYTSCYQRHCDEVLFYPGAQSAQKLDCKPFKGEPIIIQSQYKGIAFEVKPIKEQLAMIRLQEPIQHIKSEHFPTIGNLQSINLPFRQNQQPHKQPKIVGIAGYPIVNKYEQFFKPNPNIKKGFFNVIGQVISYPINNGSYEIQYDIETVKGLSGSPLYTNKGIGEIVIGIHTHKGKKAGYNAGLYFNQDILETIYNLNKKELLSRKEVGLIKFAQRHQYNEVLSSIQGDRSRSFLSPAQGSHSISSLVSRDELSSSLKSQEIVKSKVGKSFNQLKQQGLIGVRQIKEGRRQERIEEIDHRQEKKNSLSLKNQEKERRSQSQEEEYENNSFISFNSHTYSKSSSISLFDDAFDPNSSEPQPPKQQPLQRKYSFQSRITFKRQQKYK